MSPNTILSAAASAGLISAGLLLFNQHAPKGRALPEEAIRIEEPPPLPPEPPEVKKAEDPPPDDEDAPKVLFAPPSLVDIPGIRPDSGFVEPITPPTPPGIPKVPGLVTIPSGPPVDPGRGKIFDPSQLEQVPVAKVQMQPAYPYDMKRGGIEGIVTVGFIVDPNGDVRNAYAIGSTRREFEAAAVLAVSKWKFRPGWKGGRAVNTRMSVPIVFRIEN